MRHFSEFSGTGERILDVAQQLLQQRGYAGFSYDDVAQAVEIRKASIHHHFPTKPELVATVNQRYTHRFREALLRIEGLHAKAPARLTAYAALFQQTFAQDRRLCVCGMLAAEHDGLPELVQAEVKHFFEVNLAWLEQVMQAGERDGSLRLADSPARSAALWLAALEGAMVVGRAAESALAPEAVARGLLGLITTA